MRLSSRCFSNRWYNSFSHLPGDGLQFTAHKLLPNLFQRMPAGPAEPICLRQFQDYLLHRKTFCQFVHRGLGFAFVFFTVVSVSSVGSGALWSCSASLNSPSCRGITYSRFDNANQGLKNSAKEQRMKECGKQISSSSIALSATIVAQSMQLCNVKATISVPNLVMRSA